MILTFVLLKAKRTNFCLKRKKFKQEQKQFCVNYIKWRNKKRMEWKI